jgi:DNA-binding response OmpR family regulator
MRETELSPFVGFPGEVDPPFGWDELRVGQPDIVVYTDLVEFLERIGTTRTTDVVFQASRGVANALKVCRMLKQHTNATVHLVCIAPTEDEIAQAANFGIHSVHDTADGYAGLAELLRESRQRTSTSKVAPELVVGTIRIDTGRRKIFIGSIEMPTTKTEFEILTSLGRHPGEIVTRQELIEHVWGSQWYGAPNVLDTHITHLRAKLLEAGCGSPVNTVRGVGFYIEPPQTPSMAMCRDQAIA